jgi:murein DD-endopeptidase MepM/ murein hydrolase activator NlpD
MLDYWPVSYPKITQLFGENPEYYSDLSQHPGWSYPGHNGLDMGGSDKIVSACDGLVSKIGYEEGGYGIYVRITSGSFLFYYAHLQVATVSLMSKVKAGEYIGVMDSTGCSTGTHLHFGIKGIDKGDGYKGYIDPLPELPSLTPPTPEPVEYPSSGFGLVVAPIGVMIRREPSNQGYVQGVFNENAIIPYTEITASDDGISTWMKISEGLYSCAKWAGEIIIKPIDK